MGISRELALWAFYDRYQFDWMTLSQGSYNPMLVWENFAYYASMIYLITLPEGRWF